MIERLSMSAWCERIRRKALALNRYPLMLLPSSISGKFYLIVIGKWPVSLSVETGSLFLHSGDSGIEDSVDGESRRQVIGSESEIALVYLVPAVETGCPQ